MWIAVPVLYYGAGYSLLNSGLGGKLNGNFGRFRGDYPAIRDIPTKYRARPRSGLVVSNY